MHIKTTIAAAVMALCAPLAAHAQDTPTANKFIFCSGLPGGNYEYTGIQIARQLPGEIIVRHTQGSMENMALVDSGVCQGGIVQNDAYYLYMMDHPSAAINVERTRSMYPEYAHLICNKTISEISDLTAKNTVLVGPLGSGSSVTWDAIVSANPKYKNVQTLPLGGIRALDKVIDGTDAQCMLFVAGLKTHTMLEANEVAKSAGNLHLTYMRDPALFVIKDSRGRPVYIRSQIPDGTYPKGLQEETWNSNGKAVPTIQVESIFIDNLPWADAHSDDFNAILTGVNKAMPAINQKVLPHAN